MKTKNVLSKIVGILIITFIVGSLFFFGCKDNSKKYHDIEIYIQQKYLDKDVFGEKVYHTGIDANFFLPKYEDIEYNYSEIDFYIFSGTATLSNTAVTFALDLKFDDKEKYESAKQNELSTREFMTEYEDKKWNENPVFEFTIGDFVCKTVYDDDYPRRFGLICLNDNSLVLRYLYFEEWESPEYVKDSNYIFNCTNCPWKN